MTSSRPQQQEITVTLTIDNLNKVLLLLGKAPFEEVAEVIIDIRTQAGQQIQAINQAQQQFVPPQMPTMPGARPNGEDSHA